MAFAEREACRLGRSALRLQAHERMTRNLSLYESLGYRRTGLRPVEAGRVVLMRKELGGG